MFNAFKVYVTVKMLIKLIVFIIQLFLIAYSEVFYFMS